MRCSKVYVNYLKHFNQTKEQCQTRSVLQYSESCETRSQVYYKLFSQNPLKQASFHHAGWMLTSVLSTRFYEVFIVLSLTCVLCKVMEHIITSQLVKHFNKHNILYELQHGFREKRSCETQLIMLIHELLQTMQKGKQTDLILLDFS